MTLLTELVGSTEQCHLRCMTEKAPPAGWVVQVTIPATPALSSSSAVWRRLNLRDAPSFKYFNVAIAAAAKALEATTKHSAETEDREVGIVRGLSSKEIAALRLMPGEVKPA